MLEGFVKAPHPTPLHSYSAELGYFTSLGTVSPVASNPVCLDLQPAVSFPSLPAKELLLGANLSADC
jgi:hypothetical protein